MGICLWQLACADWAAWLQATLSCNGSAATGALT